MIMQDKKQQTTPLATCDIEHIDAMCVCASQAPCKASTIQAPNPTCQLQGCICVTLQTVITITGCARAGREWTAGGLQPTLSTVKEAGYLLLAQLHCTLTTPRY